MAAGAARHAGAPEGGTAMKKLLISGHDGRMGQAVAALAGDYGFEARAFAPGMTGDVIVDFSHPDCLTDLLKSNLPLVIGTTGYTPTQQRVIAQAAGARPIFQATNFSPGVFALTRLARQARTLLPDWQTTLIERHHAAKQDSPSGTALRLAEAAQIAEIHAIRAGTVRGVHELTFYGSEETLTLMHNAESRDVFAHGALRAAVWLMGRQAGLYGMEDLWG